MFRKSMMCVIMLGLSVSALGWGGVGHKAVTYLALDAMQETLETSGQVPAWLFTQDFRDRVAYQSIEPDRRRAVRAAVMRHENNPEHYLDIEMLTDYGLTMDTLPELRRAFIKRVVEAHAEHPERFADYDPTSDSAMVYYFPGFAPYAAMEQYYKLVASFRMVRMLERLSGDDQMRLAELGQARANAVYTMGVLSHWIGDIAQPLHTTIHHHGWVGENPQEYSTEYSIHAYIDSGVIEKHSLGYARLRTLVAALPPREQKDDVWVVVKEHLARSHGELEELYRLERDGALDQDEGKRFIVNRLADGGQTLAGLYLAAWEASALDDDDVANYLRYEPSSKRSP